MSIIIDTTKTELEAVIRYARIGANNCMIGHSWEINELVRCKDCEFYTEEERWCRRLGLCGAFDPNGYCSHAERKEE